MKTTKTNLATPVAAGIAAMLLAGCAAGPDYARPQLNLPERYTSSPSASKEAEGVPLARLSPELDVPAQWWQAFRSEPLNALVTQSLAGNPTIEAADAALRAAQENEAADRAAFWPSVALG